jgi:predicted permease
MRQASIDLRHAFRSILRTPLFAAAIVVLLALGLGANTLIFTTVDRLLLRPLPVAKPDQLVRLGVRMSPTHVSYDHPYLYCSLLREGTKSFSDVFVSWPLEMALTFEDRSESILGETVSGNYFAALGLTPAAGRLLTPDDERSDAPVAVLSEALRKRLFADRSAIGSTITLRGNQFTVVGVVKPDFVGTDLEARTDVWVTMSAGKLWFTKQDNSRAASYVFLRLREGVRYTDAEAEVRAIFPAMVEADYAGRPGVTRLDIEKDKARTPSLDSAARGVLSMRKTFAGAVSGLMGAVAALLLLVCANIGGLMVARGEAQSRETALRLSVGATRWSILRRTFAEVLFLSLAGAVGGWLIASSCGGLLLEFLPQRRPLAIDLAPDLNILLFAALACILTAVLLTILPAWQGTRIDPGILLARVGTGRASAPRVSRILVACQVAFATVLIIGALSLVRTLDILRTQDPGFRRQNLVVMTVNPRMAGVKSEQIPQVFDEIMRQAEAIPGVESASLASRALLRGIGLKATVGPAGARVTFADALNASVNSVSLTHLSNFGMRVVEGRGFRSGDDLAKPDRAIVNESFAHRFFPGVTAIGKTFGTARPGSIVPGSTEIIAVVRDAKYRTMREAPPPTFYRLLSHETIKFSDGLVLHVGSRSEPRALIQQLREMLSGIGTGLAPTDVATMEQEIETSLWQERLLAALASVFAAVAVVLAGLGLFGVLAYAVSRRTREIGIRVAIGATVNRIAALVVREAAWSVLPGLIIGLAMWALAARAIAALLYGITPWNAFALIVAFAGVLALSAIATLAPAARAVWIQPSEALREE